MENPKHKIGDKVIIKDLRAYVGETSPEDVYIVEGMIPYFGQTARITKTDIAYDSRCYKLDCDNSHWTWSDWMFESSNVPVRKFKRKLKSRVRF